MNRRDFMKSILAAGVAPAFIGSSVLMPVRNIWLADEKKISLKPIILRVSPALSIAKSGKLVFRWDEQGSLISDNEPWNEIDAQLLTIYNKVPYAS